MSTTATQSKPPVPAPGTYQPKGMLIGGKWAGSVSGADAHKRDTDRHGRRPGVRT